MMRKQIREIVIRMIKDDLVKFISDHEEDLIRIFKEELQVVDDRVDDEKTFVDLRLAYMGEELMRGVLQALRRFFKELK